tara:strand:- start:1181 stop:1378 length:198 start_codon:yes stop_codon:yes gene_type:complete
MEKEFYTKFKESEWFDMPSKFTQRATILDNNTLEYRNDERFNALYKDYTKAKRLLEIRKFQLRNT